MYEEAIKNICEKDASEFNYIVEQERPTFDDKLIQNENANSKSLYRFILDESQATEEDYKAFCKYIYAYIGMDFDDLIFNDVKKSLF